MEKYVSLNLFAIRMIGVWYPDNSSWFLVKIYALLRIVTLASIFLIFLPAAVKVKDLLEQSQDISTGVENLAVMTSSFTVFGKTINIVMKKNQISILLDRMSDFWKNSTNYEIQAMTGYAEIGRTVTRCYFILGVSSTISFIFQPLFNAYIAASSNSSIIMADNIRLPFNGWENIIGNESPSLFAFFYIAHVFAGAISSLASIGYDCLFVVLILHVCANYKAIAATLKNFQISEADRIDEKIIECAEKFQNLTEYTENLESILSFILLAQSVSSTFVICFTSFMLNREIKSNNELGKYIAYWSATLFQLFIFCWAGNHLQTEAHEVGRSAYEAYGKLFDRHDLKNRHHLITKTPRHLQMIIIRAQNPVGITAGKFYVMSLENYKNILSSSYSYFTILRAFADKKI